MMGHILEKLDFHQWKFITPSHDTFKPTPVLELINEKLKPKLDYAANHLKLWDLLDEAYLMGNDTLVLQTYALYGTSVYFSMPIQKAALCDYFDVRILPPLVEFIKRSDYASARRLVFDLNKAIDAMQPEPTMAWHSPRLQGYFNLFRRLEAALNDLNLLYGKKAESDLILQAIYKSSTLPLGTIQFFRKSSNKELVAWADYFEGARLLEELDAVTAGERFEAALNSDNRRLKELAALGVVRSAFWSVSNGKLNTLMAKTRIIKTSGVFLTERYGPDAKRYVDILSEPPKSRERASK